MVAAVNLMPLYETSNSINVNLMLDNAVRLLGWNHLRCLAHSINLVVQEGISAIDPIRKKVKAIVGYFHRSTKGADKFRETQVRDEPSKTPKKLINEVLTRWNSTFLMLERFCEVRISLVSAIAVLGESEVSPINDTEWNLMSQAVKLLQPFYECSTELCSEKNVSASKVIVLVGALKKSLNIAIQKSSGDVQQMGIKMRQSLTDRFTMLEGQQMLSMPTFLDPRFKKSGFTNQERFNECKVKVQNAIARLTEDDEEVSQLPPSDATKPKSSRPKSSLWVDFDKSVRDNQTGRTAACAGILEVRQYIEDAQINRKADPLKYWQKKEAILPRLAKLAKKHLSLVATSAPSERVFSVAGQLVSERRSRLTTENVEKIMFMHENIEFFDE